MLNDKKEKGLERKKWYIEKIKSNKRKANEIWLTNYRLVRQKLITP